MKEEYDFTNAEQGKFSRPLEDLQSPIYLDSELRAYFREQALKQKIKTDQLIEQVLRKEMQKAN